MSESDGSSWFVRILRVDERPPAVHVLRSLAETPALPGLTALRSVRAVEFVREDRLRDVDLDPPECVDQILEAVEVDDHDVIDRQAREISNRRQGQRRSSELVRRVDLPRAETGDVHAEVARDREVGDAMRRRIRAQEEERVRPSRIAATRRPSPVGPDHESGRRRRQQRPVHVGETVVCASRKTLVRLLHSSREREEAHEAPDDRQHENARQPEQRPGPPATSPGRCGRGRRVATVSAAVFWSGTLPLARPPRYTR